MDRRIRKSRAAIKQALIDAMQRKDMSHITVTELCKAADLNRSTFYANYSDIDDVLTAVYEDTCNEILATLRYEPKDEQPLLQSVESLSRTCRWYQDNKDLLLLLWSRPGARCDFVTYLLDFFAEMARDGQDDPRLMYPMIYAASGAFNVLRRWLMDGCPISPDEMSRILVQLTPPNPQIDNGEGQKE